jgi:HK97 family phage major capsid protein
MSNENELSQLAKDLKLAADNVKSTAEKHAVEIKNLGDASLETKAAADKALVEMNTLSARVQEVERQLSRAPGGAKSEGEYRTAGAQVTDSDGYKSFLANGGRGTVRIEIKAVTSVAGSAGDLIQPDRRPGIIATPRQRLRIRDLLAPGTTTSNSVEAIRQTGFTNNAAVVAETTLKPESDITFEPFTVPVRTIAHWVPISRQAMDDAPQLQSIIDSELRFGLDYAEEREMLTGDGTGQHLRGLIPEAVAYSAPITIASPTRLDMLRLGMLQASLAEYPATGMVLHPADYAAVTLLKNTAGDYIYANPQSLVGPTLWGLPVVETVAIDIDKFLIGAFAIAAQVYDRMGTEVLISSEDRDNFVKNMLTARAEKRVALAVKRSEALVYGDFGAVA